MKSTPFLKEIASHLLVQFDDNLSELAVVFPNKRAGLFFRHYLNSLITKPIWSPTIIDISGLIQSQSNLQLADQYSLVFKLYECYNQILTAKGYKTEDSERFYPWGNLLIRDFNEIDKYLVHTKDIFTTVKELKTIDNHYDYLSDEQIEALQSFWENVQISKKSEHKDKFLKMWEILEELYLTFTKKLNEENLAYEGMIYRDVCERLERLNLNSTYKQIVFAGFNILNKSEEKLIQYLQREGKAHFYWDIDPYFLDKKNFPVGEHMKEMLNRFPQAEGFQQLSTISHKQIDLIGVSLEAGQAKVAGNIVKSFKKDDNIDTAAIVLASEHLLFPLLQSLPPAFKDINVTMGYPMKNTRISSFLELLVELQKHIKVSGKQVLFYHTDVLAILRHPLIRGIDSIRINEKIKRIADFNKVFISVKELNTLFESASQIFSDYRALDNPFDYFLQVLEFCYYQLSGAIEKEFTYAFHKEVKSLSNTVLSNKVELSEKLFFRLIKELISRTRLPFIGEPLSGLQVMGSLETRCLDFSKLIILGMNEGYWPKNSYDHSFIPYNLRKAFGLPTLEQDDALYAYYFYRLIQKAEQIYLIYNTEATNNSSGEISRYISQLKYDFDFEIHEKILAHHIKKVAEKEIVISKDKVVITQLNRYLANENGKKILSPSALNTYIDCSLRFYFRYISDLYEPDQVKEEVDHAMFGNLLHHSMEHLYRKFKQESKRNQILVSDFVLIDSEIDPSINQAFNKVFASNKANDKFEFEGQNILIRNMIRTYVLNILNIDRAYAPFEIISLEQDSKSYVLKFDFELKGIQNQVQLSGIIDRVDKKADTVRLLDYKTGRDEKSFGEIEHLFDRDKSNRNKAAFQTLLYSFIYSQLENESGMHYQPGIYNVRNMHKADFDSRLLQSRKRKKYTINSISEVQDEFELHLKKLLGDLFDPSIEFRQTEDKQKCEYCPYKAICNR